MTTPPPAATDPHTIRAMLLCLGIEFGYVSRDGSITPLGKQYLEALQKAGELNIQDAPNRLDPSGGKEWSEAHSDF